MPFRCWHTLLRGRPMPVAADWAAQVPLDARACVAMFRSAADPERRRDAVHSWTSSKHAGEFVLGIPGSSKLAQDVFVAFSRAPMTWRISKGLRRYASKPSCSRVSPCPSVSPPLIATSRIFR